METRTDRAKTQIQVAERLLLIARLLWRASVSHEKVAERLAEEYRNVEPADAEARASIGRRIVAHAKTPGPIMKDSVDRMAAVLREAAESRLLDAEAARISAMYASGGVNWWQYLSEMQRHYCGLASPTMGDMDVTANAIESISRGIVAASVGGSGKKRAGTRKPDKRKPLTDDERTIFDAIPTCPDAKSGKELVAIVSGQIPGIDEARISRICTKTLKAYGVKNRRGAGYCRNSDNND